MKAAKKLQELGAKNVIITGSNETKNEIEDLILESDKDYNLKGKKIRMVNHGSGCNYSASITASLAMKKSIRDSAQHARTPGISRIAVANNKTLRLATDAGPTNRLPA